MRPPGTLILSRNDVARALSPAACIRAVEQAFGLAAGSHMEVPKVVHLSAADGAFHVKSAGYRAAPYYVAVKVNGNFPANPQENGLPTIQGAIVLSDGRNGAVLAIMDSTEVTALRTGAATAVAAKYLAPAGATTATIIGCGVQGRIQLRMLLQVLPLARVHVADSDPERARRMAGEMRSAVDCEVVAVREFAEATRQSRVIVTCTSARHAFLGCEHVSPGTFIAAVGADNPDKQEIEPALMARSRVFVDSIDQCVEIGDLRHAVAAGAMSRDDVVAELGDVVASRVKPEIAGSDIVVFDSTGTAIQDVAAAGTLYERSIAEAIGRTVEFN